MGTNSKLHLQLTRRSWYDAGSNGETYSDLGHQNTWEATRAQPGTPGILVNDTGGTYGASFGPEHGTPAERAQRFFAQARPLLPDLAATRNGRAHIDDWAREPSSFGSHSYWRVGGCTSIAGAEREPSGTCHFAGEHTCVGFQGYLNGAVETGYRAAADVLEAYRRS